MEPPKISLPPKFAGRFTLSIPEVVEATGLGRSTVYELIRAGDLKKTRVGGRTFVLIEDLRDLLATCAARGRRELAADDIDALDIEAAKEPRGPELSSGDSQRSRRAPGVSRSGSIENTVGP